jgi:hypothetical protein
MHRSTSVMENDETMRAEEANFLRDQADVWEKAR